jgi:hypothetical protein
MFKNYFFRDLEYGLKKEIELLPFLQNYFNDNSITKLNKMNCFDFIGNQKFIELKARNNNYNKYESTMIGYNKIKKASEINEDVYFFFCFTDGLFYYKYNKNDQFEIRKGGRYDRIRSGEIKDYVYIPISLLTKVS